MPRRSDEAFLDDIVRAADHIASMAAGASLDGYVTNNVIRWAIERQLFIVGEATYQLQEAKSSAYDRLGSAQQNVAFRHVLAHGYFKVDDRRVWEIVTMHLPKLRHEAAALLRELDPLWHVEAP
ncbi:MAG: DUF86 domain-containing protein [Phycisphaerales bacterium]|nr:DUF86 domain-containing protein [Phycisphaerales bacterium]